jgi:phenylalanyl-tRNA synthetase alpha chain
MPPKNEPLTKIESQARRDLDAASDEEALEGWRVAYLGRRGRLTLVLRSLSGLPIHERKETGARANALKRELEEALEGKRAALAERKADALAADRIDITLPGPPLPDGRLHPSTQTLRDVLGCLSSMGFQVAEGPEVEWERYNFDALRIPKDHPARDMLDTFWLDYERDGERPMLLRTHTSPMQVRIMEQTEPPIRIVAPGRCYRHEATDPTHEWMMIQVEGLAVDEGISLTDLKGTLADFAHRIFGPERKVGFRCDYFPFVEPGMELRIDCFICGGQGCRVCSRTGWIEILGAGMVHPEILESVGYDSERYTGFAFGMGIERIAMLRYGIEDIRLFYANDLRFLRQF